MSTRTIYQTVLANDLPEWALKAFEAIDYDGLNMLSRTTLMAGLRSWCATQPQRQSNYAARQARTPIPEELASVVNMVDFARMTPQAKAQAKDFMENQLFRFAPRYRF